MFGPWVSCSTYCCVVSRFWFFGFCGFEYTHTNTYTFSPNSPPFYGPSDAAVFQSILHDPVRFDGDGWDSVSQEAKDFCAALLRRDEERRPSAMEALKLNAWIRGETTNALAATTCAIESLKNFCRLNKLNREAFRHMAEKLTFEEIAKLEQEFRMFDDDLDGYITKTELMGVLKRAKFDFVDSQDIFRAIDVNGDGKIEFQEFLIAAVVRKDFLRDERIAETFRYFDSDRNGKISIAELKLVLGPAVDVTLIDELLFRNDLNGDGEIDMNEFKSMMEHALEPPSALPTPRGSNLVVEDEKKKPDEGALAAKPGVAADVGAVLEAALGAVTVLEQAPPALAESIVAT